MKLQEDERQRIESHCVANFASFVPKFCFTFSFGCPGDKVVIEVSRVQFVVVVVVVGVVYWNELNSQRISLQQKNGTHV